MDSACIKNMGIFNDKKPNRVLIKNGHRITFIGKDVEALMNRVVNPMSKLCRYNDELTLVYAVTKPIDGWPNDTDAIRQLKDSSFQSFLCDNYQDLYKISSPHRPRYSSRYSVIYSNVNLISCTPDDQFGINAMHLPTLAGMQPDLIDKVIDLTVPSHPVLPYMNIHQSPIKIDQADMGRMSYTKTNLRSNTMECKIKLPMEDQDMLRSQTVRYLLKVVSELLVYYLWLILPFWQQLDTLVYKRKDPPSTFLWPKGNGTWDSGRLTKVIAREARLYLDTSLGILTYRHLAIAISRQHLPSRGLKRDYGVDKKIADQQATHGTWITGTVYARGLQEAPGHVKAQSSEYRAASREWHSFLGFRTYLRARKRPLGEDNDEGWIQSSIVG
jgi:hypothetical protein